jgi:hypothetical protein
LIDRRHNNPDAAIRFFFGDKRVEIAPAIA